VDGEEEESNEDERDGGGDGVDNDEEDNDEDGDEEGGGCEDADRTHDAVWFTHHAIGDDLACSNEELAIKVLGVSKDSFFLKLINVSS